MFKCEKSISLIWGEGKAFNFFDCKNCEEAVFCPCAKTYKKDYCQANKEKLDLGRKNHEQINPIRSK